MNPTRWTVETSQEVDDWIDRLSGSAQRKLYREISKIEKFGRQAGYPAIEKYEDDLYSTRVNDDRAFGAFSGGKYLMCTVVLNKKKPRLSKRETRVVRDRVRACLGTEPKGVE